MKKQIFRSICFVAIGVFLAALVLIMGVLYDYFSHTQQSQLKAQTQLVAQAVEHEGSAYFDNLKLDKTRLTWIAPDGSVLYDSQSDVSVMENHLDRAEVRQALAAGYGESSRYSSTLMERQLYAAYRLEDGTVIRLSGTHLSLPSLALMMTQPILIVAVIAVVLALLLAFRLAKRIVRPLNELDLDEPKKNKDYEELQPLLERVDSQQRQLKAQAAELQRKQLEFETATDNMSEGVMLLNEQGIILSINKAASRLFSASKYCVGKDILLLNNSLALQELLRQAKSGAHSEITMQLDGTDYQINASPIVSGGAVSGIALLIFDISQKEKAEQMRREFTANVSHELKTPLHSISGYAELLQNSMVKAEDVPQFSGRIYGEAQRMIALVDDIIKLSHLDEGAEDAKWEDVDLYALAKETVRILQPSAEENKVTLTVTGQSANMMGVPALLNGIIYNLCDNAIKYNRENGSVSIDIRETEQDVILSVSDTGIGIPEEHAQRVFERFYRVDKSHSKEVGGTGLGLSIVKHAAKLHHATIELHSVVDGGTTVTVSFPKKEENL